MLETSKCYPRYHSNYSLRCPFRCRHILALNAGIRENLKYIRCSGSEVMGPWVVHCRLTPTADSLKTKLPDRLHRCLFSIGNSIQCPQQKVKCFSAKDFVIFLFPFCANSQIYWFHHIFVDKPGLLWYNIDVRKRGQRNDNL